MFTMFVDIDGTLFVHDEPIPVQASKWAPPRVLPGVIDKLIDWSRKGYKIILTTGRKNSQRKYTEWQLRKAAIPYDVLFMDVGTGPRVLINDAKPGYVGEKAMSFIVERNAGLENLPI